MVAGWINPEKTRRLIDLRVDLQNAVGAPGDVRFKGFAHQVPDAWIRIGIRMPASRLGAYIPNDDLQGFFENPATCRRRLDLQEFSDCKGNMCGECPSSKHLGLLSLFFIGGSGPSWFDVMLLGVGSSSGGSASSVS